MKSLDFENKIYLSVTGEGSLDWSEKLEEINELDVKSVALFLERFDKKERDNLYRLLLKSSIKNIPLVHLRDDVGKEEMKFLMDRYGTQYFNIHEDHFQYLDQWQGYWDKLYLEMNYDSDVAKDVKVRRIGGFCIDLAHFKAAIARGSEEAFYVFLRRNKIEFACNHLGGYNPLKQEDKHIVTDLKEFDYLTTLPKFVFGKIIALEVDNSISEQIIFKKYLAKILNDYFLEKEE